MRFFWKTLVSHAGLNAALVVVTLLSACTTQPLVCRTTDQSCGAAEDCCSGLLCTNNTCQPPGADVPDAGSDGGYTQDLSAGGGTIDFSTGVHCGDGTCSPGEAATCCMDCGCAAGSTCMANTCVAIPKCGDHICQPSESTSSCCEDCGCPSGSMCQAGTCKAPVCGNGICEVGESTDNCCDDCGCPAGLTCSSRMCTVPVFSTLNWVVNDSCYDGEEIDYKFYDVTRSLVWPGTGTHWAISPGDTVTRSLTCYTGDKICIGGRQSGHLLFWGVDIDDTKSCIGCCFTCTDGTVSIGPLTC